jgi:hypothetical protein
MQKVRLFVLGCLAVVAGACSSGGGDNSPDVWAVNSAGILMKFDLNATNQIDTSIAITGLQSGEVIEAIDFRPADNTLYGLGSTSRLYTINPTTGVATQVGPVFDFLLAGGFFGFDFNPVVDRIRVVSDSDMNMRVDPDTGVVVDTDGITPGTQIDTSLSPSGDVVAVAYTNNFAAASVTTLFGIDATTDSLVMIGGVDGTPSPNGGVVTTIGPLGVNVGGAVGFDINADGDAIMILSLGGNNNEVYTINTTTGAATLVGTITTGGNIRAITVRN